MNRILKDTIYTKGTQRQVDFLAAVGGMNEEEYRMFCLTHDGKSDEIIQSEMCIGRKTYERILESMRAKLLLAVFECINHYKDDYERS